METVGGRREFSRVRLVGRDRERRLLAGVLAETARGRGGIVLLEGEAGIGKTRVVREVTAQLEPAATVLWGSADELHRDRPFGPVLEALSHTDMSDLDGETASTSVAGDGGLALTDLAPGRRYQILERLLAAVEGLARDAPLVLVLEDLHWADRATLLVVDELARRCRQLALAVVATCRPSPAVPELTELAERVAAAHGWHVRLDRLDQAETADLVSAVLDATPSAALLASVERAAGNPLYCLELLAALEAEGTIGVRDGQAHVDFVELPTPLRQSLLRQVRGLPPETVDALRVASILGTTFSLDDLALVLDRPASTLLAGLAEPLRARLLEESGTSLRFRHALVRDAVYEELPAAARAALHLQAARALGDVGRPALEVARHFLVGAAAGDEEAITWLHQAAREAASRAPDVAVELLDAALRLGGDAGPRRDTLHAERGVALMWSGQVREGESALRALLERPHDVAVDAPSRLALAQVLLLQARAGDALGVLDQPAARIHASAADRARMLADISLARLVTVDLAGAETAGRKAELAARACADDVALSNALCVRSAVVGLRGRPAEALGVAEQAIEVTSASPVREASRRPPQLFAHGFLVELDRIEEAQKVVQAARRVSEDFGAVWDLPIAHLLTARGHFHAGEYADAVAETQACLTQAEEVGTRVLGVWAHALLGHLRFQRGELAAASAALAAAEDDVAEFGFQIQGMDWLLWTRALVNESERGHDEALALLRLVWAGHDAYGIVSERRLLGPDYVRLCVAAGDLDEAVAAAAGVSEAAALNPCASARAAALRCHGLAEGDAGVLLEAVAVGRTSPRRMEHAGTCEEAAGVLAAHGRAGEARGLLEEALGIFDAAGAVRPASRVEAALRGLGVRRGVRGRRARATTGWAALTPTEAKVARLAAEGLTNPQIGGQLYVSRRTVETHLSQVFAKLGVSSRVELAAHVATAEGGRPSPAAT